MNLALTSGGRRGEVCALTVKRSSTSGGKPTFLTLRLMFLKCSLEVRQQRTQVEASL